MKIKPKYTEGIVEAIRKEYKTKTVTYKTKFTKKDFINFLKQLSKDANKKRVVQPIYWNPWLVLQFSDEDFINFCKSSSKDVIVMGGLEPIKLMEERMKKLGIYKASKKKLKKTPLFNED